MDDRLSSLATATRCSRTVTVQFHQYISGAEVERYLGKLQQRLSGKAEVKKGFFHRSPGEAEEIRFVTRGFNARNKLAIFTIFGGGDILDESRIKDILNRCNAQYPELRRPQISYIFGPQEVPAVMEFAGKGRGR